MPFEFNPQQPSKSTEKTDKPTFDFGIDTSKPKPAEKSDKPTFDFGQGTPASKPAGNKAAGSPKTNISSKPVSKPASKPASTNTSKSGSKAAESTGRSKRKAAAKNPFQDKKVMIYAGAGIAVLLLIVIAIASNSGKSEPAPQPTVERKLTPEEKRRERLRKLEAKYDAQYAAQQSGPKTEKQKLMTEAESKLRQGDYHGAADIYVKVHQLDPTDGYPVTQLINIYRTNLHDRAQVEKWEQVNNDIAKGSLDKLQKKSEEKYNKSKN